MLQLNELDELRQNAYDSSRIYKENTKAWHDKHLVHNECHTPFPGPARLEDPNRVWGARLYTGTLYLIFF